MQSAGAAIAALEGTIGTFESKVDHRVRAIDNVTEKIRVTVNKINDSILQFKQDIISGEEVNLAQENIMRLEQIIKEEFGEYDNARKTVLGIVRDFDINLVRNKTIKEISEELWMTNSNYWLSYALIALSAWINDSKTTADSAISECIRKDKVKTTLFFCLLNLRFDRLKTSRSWFNNYLETVDPANCQYELAILLLAFLSGIFGKDKTLEDNVFNIIKSWITDLENDSNTTLAITDVYFNYIYNLPVNKQVSYPKLNDHLSNFNGLVIDYLNVSKYQILINKVNELINNNNADAEQSYNKKIDYILNHLITDFDKEEQDIKNQQQYFKFVIENRGNLTNAKEQYEEAERLRRESFNIGKQMVRWFIYDDETTDNAVKCFGLQNTKGWYIDAINKWHDKLEIEKIRNFELAIDGKQYIIDDNYESARKELSDYYESIKNKTIYFNMINISLVVTALFSIGISIYLLSLYPLIATVASVVFVIFRILKEKKEFPKKVVASKALLDDCIKEIDDFKEYYSENDRKQDELVSLIKNI